MNCPECGAQTWNYVQGQVRCPNDHVFTTEGERVEVNVGGQSEERFSEAILVDYGSHIVIRLTRNG